MSKAELLVLLGGQRETLRRRSPPGFDRYFDLKFFLEELIGLPVDLVTRGGLRNELRARVEAEAINVA